LKTLLIAIIGTSLNFLSLFSKRYAANKAIFFFSTPRKGKINREQDEFLGTAFQEELQFENYPIMTYRWLGKKETILLVHGWESNSARWKTMILKLNQKGYNVVALDAPAHGHSGSKDFNAIKYSEFIQVAIKRFNPKIIIAHSVGGMASVFCLKKYNIKTIHKLVLIGAPSEFSDVFKRYTDMMGYNQCIIQQINAIVIERFGVPPDSFSTSKFLEHVETRGLIIHDENDPIIPYSDALEIKDSFKNSNLITTKGMGHSLNNETVASHIYDFIEA